MNTILNATCSGNHPKFYVWDNIGTFVVISHPSTWRSMKSFLEKHIQKRRIKNGEKPIPQLEVLWTEDGEIVHC